MTREGSAGSALELDPRRKFGTGMLIASAGSGFQCGTADPAACSGDRLGLRCPAQQAGPLRNSLLRRRAGPVSATPQRRSQQLRGPLGPIPGQAAAGRGDATGALSRVTSAAAAASSAAGSAFAARQRGRSGGGAGAVGICCGQHSQRVGSVTAGSRANRRPGRAAAGTRRRLPPAPVVGCFVDFGGPQAAAWRG